MLSNVKQAMAFAAAAHFVTALLVLLCMWLTFPPGARTHTRQSDPHLRAAWTLTAPAAPPVLPPCFAVLLSLFIIPCLGFSIMAQPAEVRARAATWRVQLLTPLRFGSATL